MAAGPVAGRTGVYGGGGLAVGYAILSYGIFLRGKIEGKKTL